MVWDRETGEPGLSTRSSGRTGGPRDICDRLKGDGLERSRAPSAPGLVVDAYFSGTKIAWILDHVPGARSEARRAGELAFGTVDTLAHLEPDRRARSTSPTSATPRARCSSTSTRWRWDDELLGLLDVPRELLPEVRASSEVYGETPAARRLDGVPIAGIAGDQQAALFGQACFAPGMAKNTYGTGCFLLHEHGRPARARRRTACSPPSPGSIGGRTEYALEGSVFIGGAVVQWLRDGLGLIRSSGEVEALAAHACRTPAASISCRPSPAWARRTGTPTRAARSSASRAARPRGHIARAALEGIAFQIADVLEAMEARRGHRAGGAARRRRRVAPTTCSCSSRPTCSACRCVRPQGDRDHGARRGLSRRAGRRLLEDRRPRSPASGRPTAASSRRWRAGRPTGFSGAGTRRWRGPRGGSAPDFTPQWRAQSARARRRDTHPCGPGNSGLRSRSGPGPLRAGSPHAEDRGQRRRVESGLHRFADAPRDRLHHLAAPSRLLRIESLSVDVVEHERAPGRRARGHFAQRRPDGLAGQVVGDAQPAEETRARADRRPAAAAPPSMVRFRS